MMSRWKSFMLFPTEKWSVLRRLNAGNDHAAKGHTNNRTNKSMLGCCFALTPKNVKKGDLSRSSCPREGHKTLNQLQPFSTFCHFSSFPLVFLFLFLNKLFILENIRLMGKVQIQYREFSCMLHLVCPNINALHKITMIHLSKLGNESWCITVT